MAAVPTAQLGTINTRLVDSSTGVPLDTSLPAVVKYPGGLLISQTLSVVGTFFEQNWDDYDGCDLEISAYQSGATITATWSMDQNTYNNLTGDVASGTQNASTSATFTGTGAYLLRKQGKFLKLALTGSFSGGVTIKAFFRKGDFNGVVTVRGNSQTGQSRNGPPIYVGVKDSGGLGRDWVGNAAGYGGTFPTAEVVGGASVARVRNANAANPKGAASKLFGWTLLNAQASIRYLQIYDKASTPVPGTDTVKFTIPLTANGRDTFQSDIGIDLPTGLSWAITTDEAGATIGASGDIIGTLIFK
jgi:hypothetical protein